MAAWGIGFGTERVALAALDYPRMALGLLLALVVAIALSVPRLSFDDDIHRSFLSDSPLSQAQRAYEAAQSPRISPVLIHISKPAPFTAADMNRLRTLSLDLEFIDGVAGVASPFVLRWPPNPDAKQGTPLFAPEISEGFTTDLDTFEALGTGLPTLVNATRTAMVISVSVDIDQIAIANILPSIETEVGRALPPDASAGITGEDVISTEIVAGLKRDLMSLNLWGALVISLAAFVIVRELRIVVLVALPAFLGAASVLALSVWLGYPITVLSNVIPILILVLGVADGVHLASHLKETESPRETIKTVGPACALTALTTAVAFASIMLTGNAQLFEFAVLGALGTLLAFVLIITSFALLALVIPLSPKPLPPQGATIARSLIATGTARSRITVILSLILLIGAAAGFSQTRSWFPLHQNLPDTSATRHLNDRFAQEFGGVFQIIVETQTDWPRTVALVEQLEAHAPPHSVMSEVNLARWLGDPSTRPTPEDVDALPASVIDRLRSVDGASRIFIAAPEPMRDLETLAAFDTLYHIAAAHEDTRVFGLPTIMRQEAVTLVSQLSSSLVAAAIGATLLVALAFRALWMVPVLLIPNILPLLITGASLHIWARGELSPTAVLALTIAFGIAIDDTVHFLSRFANARQRSLSTQQALDDAGRSAGQVMVLTTALLTTGLAVTFVSDFTPIRLFGTMMITTLWAALLIDLLLLPALLSWRGERHDTA